MRDKDVIVRSFAIGLLTALVFSPSGHAGPVSSLFSDDFTGGMSPEWDANGSTSSKPQQWVDNGWLHSQDQVKDFASRNSGAFVHVGDTTWTDYTFSLKVEPIITSDAPFTPGFVENAMLYFRVEDIAPIQFGFSGSFYELALWGPGSTESPGHVMLHRYEGAASTLLDYSGVITTSGIQDVRVNLSGGRIEVWLLDGAAFNKIIDFTDPNPLLYGGVGVGAIWEGEARFDDVNVFIPEPATGALLLLGLLVVAGSRLRRRPPE